MLDTATTNSVSLGESNRLSSQPANLLTRKIWLPKLLYSALPFFYIIVGLLAFAATVYVSHWFWIVPHYLLFSAACLHMGVLIYRRRQRARHDPHDS
jgi:hypothetical protein